MLRTIVAIACLIGSSSAFASAGAYGFCQARTSPRPSSRSAILRLRGGLSPQEPALKYFDARGVAETTRVMFAAAGVKFDDVRYKVQMTPGAPPVSHFYFLLP